jgi:DNA-binding LytR/AlgR family response regulator
MASRRMNQAERKARRLHPAMMVLGATLAGLFLALLGPFGSYLNGGFATRALYWIVASWVGLALYGLALRAGLHLMRGLGASPWPAIAATILVGSVPQAAATHAAAYALWPELAQVGPSPFLWYLQVVALATPLTLAYALATGHFARDRRPAPRPPTPGEPALLAKLPAQLGRKIICLCMEDHYVRVYTPAGSALLLMPLGQAIAEAAPLAGVKTHRSWWVARNAVVRTEGGPRAMRLHLTNGLVAPVSRAAIATLRKEGWLAEENCNGGTE